VADYLLLDGDAAVFDVCLLIYGDLCVLNDSDRDRLLSVIRRALRPGGAFAFDVTTRRHRELTEKSRVWTAHPAGGFWRPRPYVLLSESIGYPELSLALDRYAVVEAEGSAGIYHTWFHDYDEPGIRAVLEAAGFDIESVHADLAGASLTGNDEWLGIIARKRD
jgi:SAM-dependent methyltransferase